MTVGMKQTIQGEGGVWRIRRQERSPVIEIFKIEESGHGSILTPDFLEWRRQNTEDVASIANETTETP